MADETLMVTSAQLRRCLQLLSQDEGIQRLNLEELLKGELKPIATVFKINAYGDTTAARNTLEAGLFAHIMQLTPHRSTAPLPANLRLSQYRRVVMASFNIPIGEELTGLKELTLQDRRDWLADLERQNLQVSVRTSQRILNHAIAQIADRICSGKHAPQSNKDVAELISAELEESPSLTLSDPPLADNLKKPATIRTRTLIVACLGVMLLLIAVLAVVLANPFRSPSDGASGSTSSGSNRPTDSTDGLPAGEPLLIQLSPVDFHTGQATSPDLVVPGPLSSLERPPVFDGQQPGPFNAWATKHKAVYAERMSVGFVVRSGATAPFFILGATPKIVSREAPITGTWITPQGGGPQDVREMYVDLDFDQPSVTKDADWEFPLRVSEADPEIFTVVARTKACHCSWVVELVVQLANGEVRTVTVDDNGRPFELTGTSNTTDRAFLPMTESDPWPR